MRSSKVTVVIILALIVLTLMPRLVGIDRFATIDEPYWLTAGSDFYYALGQRDLSNTVYDYHPAVTTMWIVTTAMLIYFPQYRGFGQGYFDVYKESLDQFLLEHGRSALGLLTTARVVQVLLIVVLLVVVFLLLRRLVDDRAAVVAVLLVSFDPFFLGHSRLLNHEGMLALFALVSVLAALAYLLGSRRWWLLVASGVAAGLAQLTKSSSIVLVPLVGLMFLLACIFRKRLQDGMSGSLLARDFGIWLGTLVVVYVLLWPGMWVAPGKMLGEVFGNAFSYAVQGARLSAAAGEPSAEFQPHLADITYYLQSMLWRTTPVAWLGLMLAFATFFWMDNKRRLTLLVVFFLGMLFILLFGIASGRNSAHYILTSYAALEILAAIGLAEAAARLAGRLTGGAAQSTYALIVAAALSLQLASALPFYPYYYNYYNPIMEGLDQGRQNPNFGYGEGLDLAAAYLNQKPAAPDSTAMAFYGRGPFSFFYKGNTEALKTVYADAENVPQLQQILRKTDYLVIYYALQHGRNAPANLMRALEAARLEKAIWLNGIEYIRIYAMRDMPSDFLDRLQP
ncbi:MAG TPA: glycosyltransferase family 39 protein [Anaerolineales bacterium]